MDNYPRCLLDPAVLKRGEPPCAADHHVTCGTWPVDKAVKLRCAVVAENRPWSATERRSPKDRKPGRLPGERGVDASVERLPAALTKLGIDGLGVQSGFGGLPAGYDAVLEVEQVLAWAGKMNGHF
jgi:hypothetical protein